MKNILKYLLALTFLVLPFVGRSASILLPMDEIQKEHLKAYGIAYWVLKNGETVDWLLNYRGGSFMAKYNKTLEDECKIRGVSYEVVADAKVAQIQAEIADPSANMELVKLEKLPRIALYSPPTKGPLEDAVLLVLKYAEIPFDMIYDEEVLKGDLSKYDWLHLHHEDFTGQYSKFGRGGYSEMGSFNQRDREIQEARAKKLGYAKVSKMKLAVAQTIRSFTAGGGFLFAMCSGADSFDIALAAANTDIVDVQYDGDEIDPKAQSKLDYSQTVAFQNFLIPTDSYSPMKFSDIDVRGGGRGGGGRGGFGGGGRGDMSTDFFTLFDFSAKWDVVPSMLTQNHDKVIKGFIGLATAFNKNRLKPGVIIMGERKVGDEARYIHGEFGKGQWTFYGGHDPEDYQHGPNDPLTDLRLHPNSPGYRLILNNVLFPAAKKKHQKT